MGGAISANLLRTFFVPTFFCQHVFLIPTQKTIACSSSSALQQQIRKKQPIGSLFSDQFLGKC
jgi:hypothetical protein